MKFRWHLPAVLVVVFAIAATSSPSGAHDVSDHRLLVVDTDAGLDDVVALCLALSDPRVAPVSVVITPGASGGPAAEQTLGRLLFRLNRPDVPLCRGAPAESAAPAIRRSVESMVAKLLTGPNRVEPRALEPSDYVSDQGRTTILLLGPYTNLARALAAQPEIRDGIEEVIASGGPDGWNVRCDPEAFRAVAESGLPLEFVVPAGRGAKPAGWAEGPPANLGYTRGADVVRSLLADEELRGHYLGPLGPFHDELAFLYYAASAPFEECDTKGVFAPRDEKEMGALVTEGLRRGPLRRTPVVFSGVAFPDEVLAPDVRARRAAIIEKNGEDEWFAELVMNELHEHLGAWSVMGVKMAVRAAELLNAPPHAMDVVSRSAAGPPESCLNDGVIAGSGSTVGRGLFRHEPGPPGSSRVQFALHGRSVTLAPKEAYRRQVAGKIAELVREFGLSDPRYWTGVREFGLEIWENWHRTDLFDVEEGDEEGE